MHSDVIVLIYVLLFACLIEKNNMKKVEWYKNEPQIDSIGASSHYR